MRKRVIELLRKTQEAKPACAEAVHSGCGNSEGRRTETGKRIEKTNKQRTKTHSAVEGEKWQQFLAGLAEGWMGNVSGALLSKSLPAGCTGPPGLLRSQPVLIRMVVLFCFSLRGPTGPCASGDSRSGFAAVVRLPAPPAAPAARPRGFPGVCFVFLCPVRCRV